MVTVSQCPICLGKLTPFLNCVDHFVSQETFTLQRCEPCSFLITTPRPEDTELPKYYQSSEYLSHGNERKNLFERLYHLAKRFNLTWKRTLVEKESHLQKAKILDIGCGTGEFLGTMKEAGWAIEGVEPNDKARSAAKENTNSTIGKSLDSVLNTFDVITLWHVLEHIPNLPETIQEIKKKLRPEGTLIIAVPNHESYDAKKYQADWAGYDVPRHLWHFSKASMKALATRSNLRIVNTIPMKLDGFYVSMLSEKYKRGKGVASLLRGAATGLLSNIYSGKDKNYSSLVYVMKSK